MNPSLSALLAELSKRVQDHALLSHEWSTAWHAHPWYARIDSAERFAEWFLLERSSEALGATPVQAWAPNSLKDDDPWSRILDAQMGVFQLPDSDEVTNLLSDLWSGQTFQLGIDFPKEILSDSFLAVGRLGLDANDQYRPLPGFLYLNGRGLIAAIKKDIAAARAENPRARLSQVEMEALLAGHADTTELEACEEAALSMESFFTDEPTWDWERSLRYLESHSQGDLLDTLAFETNIDIEAFRQLLPQAVHFAQSKEKPEQPRSAPTSSSDEISSDPERALQAFDLALSEGRSVEEAFSLLEEALDLPIGTSAEPDLLEESQTTAETGELSTGLAEDAIYQTYLWELNHSSDASLAQDQKILLEEIALQLQPEAAAPNLVSTYLTWLLQSSDQDEFESRVSLAHPYLKWLAEEQNFPLTDFLSEWGSALASRVKAILSANLDLQTSQIQWDSHATVTKVNPAYVKTETKADDALVVGLGSEANNYLACGDLVLGKWSSGQFNVARIFPKEAIPAELKAL